MNISRLVSFPHYFPKTHFFKKIFDDTYCHGVIHVLSPQARNFRDRILRGVHLCDSLTGLPNRSLFFDRLNVTLAQAKRNQQTLTVLFLDLDRFKEVNDTLGHHADDQLLAELVKRLADCFREGDMIARMGGDEFAAIRPNITRNKTAKRILELFHDPFKIISQDFFVTTSIGISIIPDDGGDLDKLIKKADTAMYGARETGENAYQIYKGK